jgi:hypothetical protein
LGWWWGELAPGWLVWGLNVCLVVGSADTSLVGKIERRQKTIKKNKKGGRVFFFFFQRGVLFSRTISAYVATS